MLRCPVDESRLDTHSTDGVRFAACRRCSGVWLDRDALRRQATRPLPLPGDQRRGVTAAGAEGRDRDCLRGYVVEAGDIGLRAVFELLGDVLS